MSLAALIDEHGEELEYDLIRYCSGTDLAWLWTGRLSWRRLGVLVKHLPAESATKTAIRNATPLHEIKKMSASGDYGPWSQTDMLLARIGDGVEKLFWAKTKDGAEGRNYPEPFPRPGVPHKNDLGQSAEVLDMMKYIREHNGASPAGYTAMEMPDGYDLG